MKLINTCFSLTLVATHANAQFSLFGASPELKKCIQRVETGLKTAQDHAYRGHFYQDNIYSDESFVASLHDCFVMYRGSEHREGEENLVSGLDDEIVNEIIKIESDEHEVSE